MAVTMPSDFDLCVFDASPLAICVIEVLLDAKGDPLDFAFVYANEALAKIEGVSLDELIGSRFFELFPNGDRKWLAAYYRAAFEGIPCELGSISSEEGKYFNVACSPAGKTGFATCVLTDIKARSLERARYTEELQSTLRDLTKEKRLLDRLTYDFTACYFVDLNSGRAEIVKISGTSNAHHLLGRGKEGQSIDFPGLVRTYAAAFTLSAADAQDMRDFFDLGHLRDALSRKDRLTYRYESLPNKDGKRYYEGQITRVQHEGQIFTALLGFRYIDDTIAQELAYEEVLEEALEEARLNNEIISAISKIYVSIYRVNLIDDSYEEVSCEGEQHTVHATTPGANAYFARLCEEQVDEDYKTAVESFLNLTSVSARLAKEEYVGIEYQMADKNWHTARFIAKHRDQEGRATHVLLVTSSVSDAKRREEQLAVIAQEAKVRARASTDFLSRMAHDIRTPMNAIKGFGLIAAAEVEGGGAGSRDKALLALKRLDESCDYLQRLVDDVLDLTSIERGAVKANPRQVSLEKVFSPFTFEFDASQQPQGLTYRCDIHDIAHDQVIIDDMRVMQVVNNLLSNAFNYTPNAGTVSLEVCERALDLPGFCRLEIRVADTGEGISKEFLDKIYGVFSRETDTRVNKVRGMGLGLAVTKQVVDLLGGSIDVQSEKGKGTCFTVAFDVEYVDDVGERADVVAEAEPGRSLNVLVAEDNDLNWEVASTLLDMHGVTCKRASNGKECLELFSENPGAYDAILMDMQMPVMNGIEAAAAIRLRETGGAHIPIVALTANAFESDEKACLAAGMDAHLSKPFNIDAVLAKLAELCA